MPIRLLKHPGPVEPLRWSVAESRRSRALRITFEPGRTLHDTIVEPLHARGILSAALNIAGGLLGDVTYCLTVPRAGTNQVASYTPALTAEGPVMLVAASATLGEDTDGSPLVHLHIVGVDRHGRVFGGHVFPETTLVGAEPPVAQVRDLGDIAVRRRYDPETNFSLLQPGMRNSHHG